MLAPGHRVASLPSPPKKKVVQPSPNAFVAAYDWAPIKVAV